MKRSIIICCVVITMMNACKKSDSDNSGGTNTSGFKSCVSRQPAADFSKITETDNFGQKTGTSDSSDWTNDLYDWTCTETRIFHFSETGSSTQTGNNSFSSVTTYPNPAKSTLSVSLNLSNTSECICQIVIVDSLFHSVFSHTTSLTGNEQQLMLNVSSIPRGYYRLYYILYQKGGYVFSKGHGDVKLIN